MGLEIRTPPDFQTAPSDPTHLFALGVIYVCLGAELVRTEGTGFGLHD